MKKLYAFLVVFGILLGMTACSRIQPGAAAEPAPWYAISESGETLTITLPATKSETGWVITWLNGGESFSADETGAGTIAYRPNAARYGYATLCAADGEDVRGLTVFVDEACGIDFVREGFLDALPLDAPVYMMFTSGVGAWFTELTLNPDGTFYGSFHDSEMGDKAEEYPFGTVYLAEFTGTFSRFFPMGHDRYGIVKAEILVSPEETGIKDGIRYVPAAPAGLEETQYILCMPDTPTRIIDDEIMTWLHEADPAAETLGCYALCNTADTRAFCSVHTETAEG